MNAIELKPCPFCGCPAEMDTQRGYTAHDGRRGTAVAVYCTFCPADISETHRDFPDITPEDVAEMWNKRATLNHPPTNKEGRL